MPEQTTERRTRSTGSTSNSVGTAGWFSAAGFVVMGLLYVLDLAGVADSILSPTMTLLVAVLAGVGALLFYVGNDPTA